MSQGGEVKTEEMGKTRIPGQSLGRMVVIIKQSTNFYLSQYRSLQEGLSGEKGQWKW